MKTNKGDLVFRTPVPQHIPITHWRSPNFNEPTDRPGDHANGKTDSVHLGPAELLKRSYMTSVRLQRPYFPEESARVIKCLRNADV